MNEQPAYDLRIHKAAETELASVVGNDGDQVMDRINEVQTTEKFSDLEGVGFLRDYQNLFRIKVGRYRVILRYNPSSMEIVLLAVGKRNPTYNRLEPISERELL